MTFPRSSYTQYSSVILYPVVPQGRGHSSAILEAACAPTSSLRRGLEGCGFQIMPSHACPKAWSEGLPGFWDAGRWKLEHFLESCRVELSHGGNRRALLVWFYLWMFSFPLNFLCNSFSSSFTCFCFTPIVGLLSNFFGVWRATTKKYPDRNHL